jgi:prepilin-type processing-associated H-X9-DG protein
VRIYPYIKSVQVFNCPSATDKVWQGDPTGAYQMRYGANDYLLYNNSYPNSGIHQDSVVNPTQTFLIADSDGTYSYSIELVWQSDRYMSDRHLNGSNILFCDGHVKWKHLARDASDHPIQPTSADGVYYLASGTS